MMHLLTILCGCHQEPTPPPYVPPPPLVLQGVNIPDVAQAAREKSKRTGRGRDLYEQSFVYKEDCPLSHIQDALGYPHDFRDEYIAWKSREGNLFQVWVSDHPKYIYGCTVRVFPGW